MNKSNLNKFMAIKTKVEAAVPQLDAARQTVPAETRSLIAQKAADAANTLFNTYQ